jgi:hypothetical protein
MKNILKHIYLLLFFVSSVLQAQTSVMIEKADYTVSGSTPVLLLATQSITIKPTSIITAGSNFIARINSDSYIPLNFSNENYIFTRSFQTAMTSAAGISNNTDVKEAITYFDGLGRPMQSIGIKASPDKQDIVTYTGYDGFGRQDKNYLPYRDTSSAVASYRTGADTSTNSYYTANYASDINSAILTALSSRERQEKTGPLALVMK